MSDKATKSPRRQLRRAADPDAWRKPFLEALRASANIYYAARTAGIGRSTAYRHRQHDPEFRALWDDAIEDAIDVLALEARNRALKSSDTLLMFLLKAHKPEMYRENISIEHHTPQPWKPWRFVDVYEGDPKPEPGPGERLVRVLHPGPPPDPDERIIEIIRPPETDLGDPQNPPEHSPA